MGFTRRVETSTSATLELLAFGILLLSSVVVLINVWEFTSFPANNRCDWLSRATDIYHQGLLDARLSQRYSLDQ